MTTLTIHDLDTSPLDSKDLLEQSLTTRKVAIRAAAKLIPKSPAILLEEKLNHR